MEQLKFDVVYFRHHWSVTGQAILSECPWKRLVCQASKNDGNIEVGEDGVTPGGTSKKDKKQSIKQ